MLVTEPPSINPEDHTVLEVGMVISTEPGLRMGDVHFPWEDTHVITEDGHQQLTLETAELREIPF
jgi:Xaa-Pro aminopeptidase